MRITSQKVLYIERDWQFAAELAGKLEKRGIRTLLHDDPATALRRIGELNSRIVLLGIDAAEQEGVRLLGEIKREDGGVQVIVLSQNAPTSLLLELFRHGAEACFAKCLTDVKPLAEAIRAAETKIERWRATLAAMAHERRLRVEDADRTGMIERDFVRAPREHGSPA